MRTIISRVLLAAVVVVTLVAIVRFAGGTSHGGDAVHYDGLDPHDLEHTAVEVTGAGARVAIEVVGSFEGTGPEADSALAALGWLVRRDDGRVVWRPRPRGRAARGTVYTVRDTLALEPGLYDAYFAAYGDPLVRSAAPASNGLGDRLRAALSRGGQAWIGEADRWRFVVRGVTDADRRAVRRLRGDRADPADASPPDALWSSGAVGNRRAATAMLRVATPSRIRVRTTTEITDGVVADSATVIDLATGAVVWSVDPGRTVWAGGSVKNRAADETVTLAPGLYRVRYRADRSHGYSGWSANPPFAPWLWGLRVDLLDGEAALLDPAAPDLPRIVGAECVGTDESRDEVFDLTAPLTVLVVAAGEIESDEHRWDYATLERSAGGRPETVWEMTRSASEPAGGTDRNRRETAVLSLEPGRYTLHYETDGSHDCVDGFGSSEPDDPLWGAILYAVSPGFDPASVQVAAPDAGKPSRALTERDEFDTERDSEGDDPNQNVLVRLDRLGPNVDESASFTLGDAAVVRIIALGELLPSESLDWGWIVDDDGDTVWEMTRSNTEPGGGASKNRRADERLALAPGTYSVHFRTNGRHDRTRFDGIPPRGRDDWGIRVQRVPADDE